MSKISTVLRYVRGHAALFQWVNFNVQQQNFSKYAGLSGLPPNLKYAGLFELVQWFDKFGPTMVGTVVKDFVGAINTSLI